MSKENFSLQVFEQISGENRSELLLKSFQLQKAAEKINFKNLKNETMCKKCLTFWSAGQFTVELKTSKQKRRLKKKFLIEKYTRELKEEKNTKRIKTLKKILRRLNKQNNQIAIYKCLICNYKTKVIFYKPIPPKLEVKISPEISADPPVVEESKPLPKKSLDEKTKIKKKKKQREKSSGLSIPPPTKSLIHGATKIPSMELPAPSPPPKKFNQKNQMLKLAEMLKAKKSNPSDKLKQLLK